MKIRNIKNPKPPALKDLFFTHTDRVQTCNIDVQKLLEGALPEPRSSDVMMAMVLYCTYHTLLYGSKERF